MGEKENEDSNASSTYPSAVLKPCSRLILDVPDNLQPIVYSPEYNVAFGLMEKLQSYDVCKWGRTFAFLKETGLLSEETIIQPLEAQEGDLLMVHPKTYLDSFRLSSKVLGIDLSSLVLLPDCVILNKILRSFRFQTGGTVLAAQLALKRGWAINLGGGLHHCCATKGGGFCPYADMTLAVRFLFENAQSVKRVMVIDLSAHQGNGLGRDFLNDDRVYILDVYNRDVYPHDGFAKRGIRRKVELRSKVEDEEYMLQFRRALDEALAQFEPDLVLYNAGSDVLFGDHTGGMFISPEGIIERDQLVFVKIRSRGIPLVMLMGGGYHRMASRITADSIVNLHRMGLISFSAQGTKATPVTKAMPPKRNSTRPELFESLLNDGVTAESGLWTRFKNFASGSQVKFVPNDAKEPQSLHSVESSFLKGIRRSLSSGTVEKVQF